MDDKVLTASSIYTQSIYFMGGQVHIGGPKSMLSERDYLIRAEGNVVLAEERNGEKRCFEIPRDRCVLERKTAVKAEGKK